MPAPSTGAAKTAVLVGWPQGRWYNALMARDPVPLPKDATASAVAPVPEGETPAVSYNEDTESPTQDAVIGPAHFNAPPSQSAQPLPFPNWERYQIVSLLGAGGMGVVYKAEDLRLKRSVAIKFLRTSQVEGDVAHQRRRFEKEARAQAKIEHPNICKIYEVGQVDGQPYITMQLIVGCSLAGLLPALSREQKVRAITQVARALQAAHELSLIHRDIKPSNIMVESRGEGIWIPYLLDFGLAREVDSNTQTSTAGVSGTPAFMAPEQARGDAKQLGCGTDIYGLGATLYTVLCGRPPFSGNSTDVLMDVMFKDPPALRKLDPSIPIDLETLTLKCLEKDPQRRYPSAKALAEDLERHLEGLRISARPPGLFPRAAKWAQRHKLLVASATTALLAAFILAGVLVRSRFQAAAQARLAQELGQEIKDMEWVMRSAHQMPLHDLNREKLIVRKRIEQLKQELQNQGELTRGLVHYALGRGHLALQEYDQAHEHLQLAIQNGQNSAAVYHALGLVGGKVFRKALRYSYVEGGSQSSRLKLLTPKYLTPTIEALKRSRTMKLDAPAYLEGLIAYYQEDYPSALRHAAETLQQAPWLYEAHRLAGDAHRDLAQLKGSKGEYQEAEKEAAAARKSYAAAAAIGQSDAEVYYDMAVSLRREMERELERGSNIEATNAQALAVAEKAITVEPDNPDAYWLKATIATMGMNGDENSGRSSASKQMENCLDATSVALKLAPEDSFVHIARGACFFYSAQLPQADKTAEEFFQKAIDSMKWVADRNPNFFDGQANLVEMYSRLAIHQQLRGAEEARANLERARAYVGNAMAIDPDVQDMTIYTLLALEGMVPLVRSKKELDELIRQADTLFARGKEQNDKNPTLYAQGGAVYTRAAWRLFLAGEDAQALNQRALDAFAAGRKLAGFLSALEQDSALSHLLDASLRVRFGQNPAPALAEAEASLKRCIDKHPENARCKTTAAQAALLQSDWLAEKMEGSSSRALKHAIEKATAATQSSDIYPDAWWVLAEIELRQAQAQPRRSPRTDQHLIAGLAATEKVFTQNPNHAKGYATAGRLLLLRAQGQDDPQARRATARSAALSFEKAQKLDPMLASNYVPWLAQATAAAAD